MDCQCGCGELVPKPNKAYVDRGHMLDHMAAGRAAEIGAMEPPEARAEGGRRAGRLAHESGRLAQAGLKGAEEAHRQAEEWRSKKPR